MKVRDLVLLLVIAVHPLLLFTALVDWPSLLGIADAVGGSAVFAAGLVEMVLIAGLVHLQTPTTFGGTHAPPSNLETTPSGFTLTVRGPLRQEDFIWRTATGTLAAMLVMPLCYLNTSSIIDWPTLRLQLYGAFLGTVLHVILQLLMLSVVALARYRAQKRIQLELVGRVLRIDDQRITLTGHETIETTPSEISIHHEGGLLTQRLPGPVIRWLAQQLEAVQPEGSAADVPDTLRQVASRNVDRARNTEG